MPGAARRYLVSLLLAGTASACGRGVPAPPGAASPPPPAASAAPAAPARRLVIVTVAGERGLPIADARVSLRTASADGITVEQVEARTDGEGRCRLDAPEGRTGGLLDVVPRGAWPTQSRLAFTGAWPLRCRVTPAKGEGLLVRSLDSGGLDAPDVSLRLVVRNSLGLLDPEGLAPGLHGNPRRDWIHRLYQDGTTQCEDWYGGEWAGVQGEWFVLSGAREGPGGVRFAPLPPACDAWVVAWGARWNRAWQKVDFSAAPDARGLRAAKIHVGPALSAPRMRCDFTGPALRGAVTLRVLPDWMAPWVEVGWPDYHPDQAGWVTLEGIEPGSACGVIADDRVAPGPGWITKYRGLGGRVVVEDGKTLTVSGHPPESARFSLPEPAPR